MKKHKINQFYEKKYDAKSEEFWKSIELTNKAKDASVEFCATTTQSDVLIARNTRHTFMDLSRTTNVLEPRDEDVVICSTVPRNQRVCPTVCQSAR